MKTLLTMKLKWFSGFIITAVDIKILISDTGPILTQISGSSINDNRVMWYQTLLF